jgi:hypothetical protein
MKCGHSINFFFSSFEHELPYLERIVKVDFRGFDIGIHDFLGILYVKKLK